MRESARPSAAPTLAGLAVLCLLVLCLSPLIGMQTLPLDSMLNRGYDSMEARIFWSLRLPRTCLAFLAGSSLAICGMVFQALFRNPLATPYTLGVSSGAALGAAIYVRLGLAVSFGGYSGITLFAFAGTWLSILIVYGISRMRGAMSTATLLLAGVAVSFFFSSLILFVQYASPLIGAFRITRWLMGGVDTIGFSDTLRLLPLALGGCGLVMMLPHELNLLLTGEDLAASRGVDVRKIRGLLFFTTSVLVGAVVALCGPIGFVGLIPPHICRLLVGPDHRWLAPASFLFGGAFLVLCDTVSRSVLAPAEVPVGVVTALLGGPFFVWLLLSRDADRATL